MRTGFKRNINGRSFDLTAARSCVGDCIYLGMGLSKLLVPALSDHLFSLHNDTADHRVGFYQTLTLPSDRDGALHVNRVFKRLVHRSAGLKEAYGTLNVEYEKNVASAKDKSDKLEDTIGQAELHFACMGDTINQLHTKVSALSTDNEAQEIVLHLFSF